jgi:hypothetical protein
MIISRFFVILCFIFLYVVYSLYFDENLGNFRSNMFARIDNIIVVRWSIQYSVPGPGTVLYFNFFFAHGVWLILIKLTMNGLENCPGLIQKTLKEE